MTIGSPRWGTGRRVHRCALMQLPVRRKIEANHAFELGPVDATLCPMSRFVEDIRHAVARGQLPQRFRPDDVRRACPGWADHTYGVFLPKHRRGNPGGYTEYFVQNPDGTYSLIH